MVEVFKTDVATVAQASMLISRIQTTFLDYEANFDLEDCDKILRVKCASGVVHALFIIEFLKHFECQAEILSDEIPDKKTTFCLHSLNIMRSH